MKSGSLALLVPMMLAAVAMGQPLPPPMPPAPVPPENPITEAKRVLGKALFFDEQLSADSTVSCATCHTMTRAGSDARRVRAPGPDGLANTPDDVFGSPGVVRSDAFENYLRDQVFGTDRQVTGRAANTPINAAYANDLFWDGRARTTFRNPANNAVVIANGGGLESQAVAPPLSGVEMGHDAIAWPEITAKLSKARPLALASNLTPDLAAALSGDPTYPDLFAAAFGDGTITAVRIAMAIATYQRTLISDQTPWDRFRNGETTALTPGQQQGWSFFQNSNCSVCHVPPLFTGNGFRNIGVRPPGEDPGRQIVTGNPADRGRFKVPTLRNVGLKNSFMHNGGLTTLTQVIQFYTQALGSAPMFPDNRDPLVPVPVPPQVAPALQDFLANGLTDPRVAAGTFPFDAPTMYGQRPADQPVIIAGGTAGSGGVTPTIIALSPPMIGSTDFKIGLDRALGGAAARLTISTSPPSGGQIVPTWTFAPTTTGGAGNGVGVATHHWPLTGGGVSAGQTVWAQWTVDDPGAAGGVSRSSIAQIRFFCPRSGCDQCVADMTGDGVTTAEDLFQFLSAFFGGELRADINMSGSLTVQDVFDFLSGFFAGCN
ncbi:MAG: cytochrome c peroxidase [Phycisphaerales bacterium]